MKCEACDRPMSRNWGLKLCPNCSKEAMLKPSDTQNENDAEALGLELRMKGEPFLVDKDTDVNLINDPNTQNDSLREQIEVIFVKHCEGWLFSTQRERNAKKQAASKELMHLIEQYVYEQRIDELKTQNQYISNDQIHGFLNNRIESLERLKKGETS